MMTVGICNGETEQVDSAKTKVHNLLLTNKEAILYREPEKPIKSRSGDKCVVAFCDQW